MKFPYDILLQPLRAVAYKSCAILGGTLLLLGAASAASATDVQMDQAGYSLNGSSVTLTASNVHNYTSGGHSGTLHLEMWLTQNRYSGGSINGYKCATYTDLGTLSGGYYFASVSSGTLSFSQPPNGTYYVTMCLTEYTSSSSTNGGYLIDDYITLDKTLTFGSTGGGTGGGSTTGAYFGIPTASYVGNGYYYESYLQYIYPFDSTVMYLYNLNRYYYVNPGSNFTSGAYIYDFYYRSWTYAYRGYWPYIYYYNGTGWIGNGFR